MFSFIAGIRKSLTEDEFLFDDMPLLIDTRDGSIEKDTKMSPLSATAVATATATPVSVSVPISTQAPAQMSFSPQATIPVATPMSSSSLTPVVFPFSPKSHFVDTAPGSAEAEITKPLVAQNVRRIDLSQMFNSVDKTNVSFASPSNKTEFVKSHEKKSEINCSQILEVNPSTPSSEQKSFYEDIEDETQNPQVETSSKKSSKKKKPKRKTSGENTQNLEEFLVNTPEPPSNIYNEYAFPTPIILSEEKLTPVTIQKPLSQVELREQVSETLSVSLEMACQLLEHCQTVEEAAEYYFTHMMKTDSSEDNDFGANEEKQTVESTAPGSNKSSKKKKPKKKSTSPSSSFDSVDPLTDTPTATSAVFNCSETLSEKTFRIKWGEVEQVSFSRQIGYSVVPHKGSFPLGLGHEESREIYSVDTFTSMRQGELEERAQSIKSILQSTICHPVLETRQFDYRSGVTNPLFHSITEEERVVLLGVDALKPRSRENSQDFSNESYSAHPIADLKRELEAIRSHRDETGCSCKPVKLDKLSVQKLKSELMTNGHLIGMTEQDLEEIGQMSKPNLMAKVREVLKFCYLCVTNGCECVAAGIECSAEVCGCLRKAGGGSGQTCGNPNGQYKFDSEKVRQYRKQLLIAISKPTISEPHLSTTFIKPEVFQTPIPKGPNAKATCML